MGAGAVSVRVVAERGGVCEKLSISAEIQENGFGF